MFNLGKKRFNQKPQGKQCYELGSLLPALTAEELLSTKGMRALLRELETLCQLPESYYDILYQQTINQFAELVQLLPYEEEGILAGLLNRSLARAMLTVRQQISQATDEPDPLVIYAVFTAALFFDVAKVLTRYKIVLTTQEGKEISEWDPFAGSMLGHGDYYRLFPQSSALFDLEHEAAVLLARQLLPKEGFLWLASDDALFLDWLLALRGAVSSAAGRLSKTLSLYKHEDLLELLAMLDQPNVEVIITANTEHADKFYRWLRDGLASGEIQPNKQGLHYIDGDFVIDAEFFQHYLAGQRDQVSQEGLRNQVERLFHFVTHDRGAKAFWWRRKHTTDHSLKQQNKLGVKQQIAAKQTANIQGGGLGFLNANAKKTAANAVKITGNLLLKKQSTQALTQTSGQSHSLPKLNTDDKVKVSRNTNSVT